MIRLRLAILLALISGCGGTTGGALITLPFQAGGLERSSAGPLTFVNPLGWTVTLQTARIALGPFYFNVSSPPTDQFRGGTFIVEVTHQQILDPLDPGLKDVPGGADGETGTAVAVEIDLLPPDLHQTTADAALLGGAVGLVAGSATNGSTAVNFSGPIDIDKSLVTPQLPLQALQRINGANVQLTFTPHGQTLRLRVDPRPWFNQTDFAVLSPPASGPSTWDVHSTFLHNLLQGVQSKVGVYRFTLDPTP